MRVLIALPALNEEASLGSVLAGIPRSLPGATDVQVVVVDDGSADRTAAIAEQHAASVVRHHRTLGVGRAFQTALDEALRRRADVLVTIDADGQFDPKQIPELVEPIASGRADFVTGSRFLEGRPPAGMPRLKRWGNRFFAGLLRFLTKEPLSDVSCGFRAYSREALLHLNLFGRFTYTQETILDLAFKDLRIAEVPVSVRYFAGRESRVAASLVGYGVNALTIITRTARDFRPMRFFGSIGIAVFLVGAVLDGWVFAYFLRTGSFSPYKFVGAAGVALNLTGLLVFGLALLADMLDRLRINQERLLYHLRREAEERRAASRGGEGPEAP